VADILKGNFDTKKKVEPAAKTTEDELEEKFEREAMKRLGGSIAFVSKKRSSGISTTDGFHSRETYRWWIANPVRSARRWSPAWSR
jgi:hypothetical protein